MRIDNILTYNDFSPAGTGFAGGEQKTAGAAPVQTAVQKNSEPSGKMFYYGPGVVVEISADYTANKASQGKSSEAKLEKTDGTKGIGGIEGPKECQTCKNRKYVDESSDPSVSYQAPTHISPGQSAGAVMSHEREHVTHEQARANREDRKVISQTVSVSTSICPECGRVYVSGGVTRTITKGDSAKGNNSDSIQPPDNTKDSGKINT